MKLDRHTVAVSAAYGSESGYNRVAPTARYGGSVVSGTNQHSCFRYRSRPYTAAISGTLHRFYAATMHSNCSDLGRS